MKKFLILVVFENKDYDPVINNNKTWEYHDTVYDEREWSAVQRVVGYCVNHGRHLHQH